MTSDAPELRFAYPWRPYQKRVLKGLDRLLSDRKLHIVAAPGSGKTILGIEVVRRMGEPALVLSPTRTIRDQWVERLRHFVPGSTPRPPTWASTDLDAPGWYTSITYQALHTRERLQDEDDDTDTATSEKAAGRAPTATELKDVTKRMQTAGVRTIVLDEAHHLRRAWWGALWRLAQALDATIVSLTATPPYDAIGEEWSRYEELCGPIDEEISVPELVRSGTLCPHQDYVWAVEPVEAERERVATHDRNVHALLQELSTDAAFIAHVERHPWIVASEPDGEAVLAAPRQAAALLVFLKHAGRRLPKPLLRLLASEPRHVPAMDPTWWEPFLEHALFSEAWGVDGDFIAYRETLVARMRNDGLLWRKTLRLRQPPSIVSALRMSRSKVDACGEILRVERRLRGEALRAVVLTDFIRDDAPEADDGPLGAWPVFKQLLEGAVEDAPYMGLLTGRLALVHRSRFEALCDAADRAVREATWNASTDLVRVEGASGDVVRGMTALLNRGDLRVLVGTRSLLGEGWDAPPVNALVLLSYVGSFMLSNQMRGRAIRKDPNAPDKVSSIWHVVSVEPRAESGMVDWEALDRRFGAFVGLRSDAPVLESGFQRLALSTPSGGERLGALNVESVRRREQIHTVPGRWREAIGDASEGRIAPSLDSEQPPSAKRYLQRGVLKASFLTAVFAAMVVTGWWVLDRGDSPTLRWGLMVAGALGVLFTLPRLLGVLWMYWRHVPPEGTLKQIAHALCDALCDVGVLETPRNKLKVRVRALKHGGFSGYLKGGSFFEQGVFADALAEVLGPIGNPRYLITRPGKGRWKHHNEVHAVPALLGTNREKADALLRPWIERLGSSELIYTRNPEGRAALLKARARSFSANFEKRARRTDRWR